MSEKNRETNASIIDKVEGGVKESARFIREKAPTVSKIIKKSDDPEEAKERTQEEAAEMMKDQFQSHLQKKAERNAEKVHSKAEEAKESVQENLLQLRERMAALKDSGQELQKRMRQSSSDKRVKGVQDIKGISHVKSATQIKGPNEVKGLSDIKTYHS
ncbi:hypothetical protein [Halobacillus yeomjeoni]|uniref:Gas vesicle protein GvpQ n=1 Tax=Halobacillus yeomjeoni TaxID=311194 RepID=A0A931HWU8_9BACI|nr:hypothetical protein [Halobacillus yeomjeoni]MBH0230830.1 hypothetical protein [Halobacillus yeomjeoni]